MRIASVTALDEALARAKAAEAERDRRIDPVEHGVAVHAAYAGAAYNMLLASGLSDEKAVSGAHTLWVISQTRADLLDRVGADVLAEVER